VEVTPQLRTALSWLRDNPSISDDARERISVPGKAFPDAVLQDPSRLVGAAKAVAMEAIRLDAPEGVVEGLMTPVRQAAAGVKNLRLADYTVQKLAGMQGLRDQYELEAALAAAREEAPDATNRALLDGMIETLPMADRPTVLEEGKGLSDCAVCCFVYCGICGIIFIPEGPGAIVAGCLVCCISACLLCSLA
jgi:hypothetical protein